MDDLTEKECRELATLATAIVKWTDTIGRELAKRRGMSLEDAASYAEADRENVDRYLNNCVRVRELERLDAHRRRKRHHEKIEALQVLVLKGHPAHSDK